MEANRQKIPLYTLTPDNLAATLPQQDGGIMAEIGYRVIDPNCPL